MLKKSTKIPKNKYLKKLYDDLISNGWTITSRGAPDFFCWKVAEDGQVEFICVEAVRKGTYRLRKHQKAVIDALARAGVRCYRYNCDSGKYQRIVFEKP